MALINSPSPVDTTIRKPDLAGPTPAAPDLTAKVADLEARLAKLEKVLRVGPAGVTIKAFGTISIESSATMQLKSGATMQLQSGLIMLN